MEKYSFKRNLWSRMWNLTGDYCSEISAITEGLIEQEGYPLEKHSVVTEDGYINCMYRIPYGKISPTNNNVSRPPVLLSHGFTCSCATFINHCCLAYYLADEGFDVWLPNNRGTTFSRKHTTLDAEKNKEKYWDFSWHEIAVYDTPAFVDYILDRTGSEKLFFIGHSQGGTVHAVFASERPEYNKKIALSCLLGPAIIMDKGVPFLIKFTAGILKKFLKFVPNYLQFPIYEVPFTNIQRLLGGLATGNSIYLKFQLYMLSLMIGNLDQTAWVDFSQFTLTSPNSSSMRQGYHYGQIFVNNRFAKYDYGPEKNMEIYGSKEPPLYDLSKITSPVALFYGKNDTITHPEDMDKLAEMMGNVVHRHVIENESFNHIDFMFAKDSISLVYSHVLRLMKTYVSEKNSQVEM